MTLEKEFKLTYSLFTYQQNSYTKKKKKINLKKAFISANHYILG